ncbi:MAG: UbiA family prenyltransferase [Desulfobacterales bacterium]
MENASVQNRYTGLSRLKLFLALSRTPHGLLDMTTPLYGALLWLGAFPSLYISLLGLITVFAGYTAVYALNDVIDYRVDKEKARMAGGLRETDNYLDAAMVRHPMAQGLLSLKEGLVWALGWSSVAMIGAWLLNPVCVLIFLAGCMLEIIYCLMHRVSPFRILISGGVKTSGAVAAVFAVDPEPSLTYVIVLFIWLFFWEIGGQNIPADWADIEEDRRLRAQTVPVRFGLEGAAFIAVCAIVLSLLVQPILICFSKIGFQPISMALSFLLGAGLLLPPALQLFRNRQRTHAMALFNRASYYPLVMLVVFIANYLV